MFGRGFESRQLHKPPIKGIYGRFFYACNFYTIPSIMLDQFVFSGLLKHFLRNNFPEFLLNPEEYENGSFRCETESPAKQFSIWITSENSEVTAGLASPDGNAHCHTHFTPFETSDIDGVFQDLADFIEEVRCNRVLFFHSSRRGYSWTDDVEITLSKKKAGESITFFAWDGRVTG